MKPVRIAEPILIRERNAIAKSRKEQKMKQAQREEMSRLVQFVTLAFADRDIGEQYRDWKKERLAGVGTPYEPKD